MAIATFPTPSTAGGASSSPFSPTFTYNFVSTEFAQSVTIDFTNTVGAGSYTISGVADGQLVPDSVQLLDASGTSVGSASLSASQGTLGSSNSGSYNGSVTASAAFAKIRFYRSNGGAVQFSTTPSVPNYHIKIDSGSRLESKIAWNTKLATDPNKITLGLNPGTVPSGTTWCGWYFNGKYYVMTQQITGNPTGSTNTVNVYAWNYSTQSWSASLASGNGTTVNMNAYATYYSDPLYNPIYVFKNGKVIIYNAYMYNTSGAGTPTNASYAWTFDMNTNVLSGLSLGGNQQALYNGGAAYNPTNDEWFSVPSRTLGAASANNLFVRYQNNNTVSFATMNYTSNTSTGLTLCQNSATPSISATFQAYSQNYLVAEAASVWGGVMGNYNTSSNIASNYTWYMSVSSTNCPRSVQTTYNGISNYMFSVGYSATDAGAYGGVYAFNGSTPGYNQVGPFGTINNLGQATASGNIIYTIQPINSTQYGLVAYTQPSAIANGAAGGYVVPFPSAITLP